MQPAIDFDDLVRLSLDDIPSGHYAVLRDGVWHARLTVLRPVGVLVSYHDGRRYAHARHALSDFGLRVAVNDEALSPDVDGTVGRPLGYVGGTLIAELKGGGARAQPHGEG